MKIEFIIGVADGVPKGALIRCQYCRKCDNYICEVTGQKTTPEDFCSHAVMDDLMYFALYGATDGWFKYDE